MWLQGCLTSAELGDEQLGEHAPVVEDDRALVGRNHHLRYGVHTEQIGWPDVAQRLERAARELEARDSRRNLSVCADVLHNEGVVCGPEQWCERLTRCNDATRTTGAIDRVYHQLAVGRENRHLGAVGRDRCISNGSWRRQRRRPPADRLDVQAQRTTRLTRERQKRFAIRKVPSPSIF